MNNIEELLVKRPLSFSTISASMYDLEKWITGEKIGQFRPEYKRGNDLHKAFYDTLKTPGLNPIYEKVIQELNLRNDPELSIEKYLRGEYGGFPFTFKPDLISKNNYIYDIKSSVGVSLLNRLQLYLYSVLSGMPGCKLGVIFVSDSVCEFIPVEITFPENYDVLLESRIRSVLEGINVYISLNEKVKLNKIKRVVEPKPKPIMAEKQWFKARTVPKTWDYNGGGF